MSLIDVRTFRVPQPILEDTGDVLRRAGDDGYELFVLWSGVIREDALHVLTPHVPKQTSYRTSDGLLVRVEGAALHKLNTWLYEAKEVLAVQLHAHAHEAFHSQTDDAYPIVTTLGGLSIVAPDFARRGVLTSGTAAFRLTERGWEELPPRDLRDAVEVVE